MADFNLPGGAGIDEDGGDLVIRDSSNNIVLRYDEATTTWQVASGSSFSTETLDYGGSGDPTDFIRCDFMGVSSGFTTYSTTNTSFETKARSRVNIDPRIFANGDMTAVAQFSARLKIGASAETATAQVITTNRQTTGTDTIATLTHTGDTSRTLADSGFIDLSTVLDSLSDGILTLQLQLKSSEGTTTAEISEAVLYIGRQP